MFRSQTDEQLAAIHDEEPWVDILGRRHPKGEQPEREHEPRVECIPSRDPEPWVVPGSFDAPGDSRVRERGLPGWNRRWSPRPEFARPPVNRVLADFRENAIEFWKAIGLPVLVEYAADWLLLLDSDPWMADRPTWGDLAGQMTPTEIGHARKVLTRLAAQT